MKINDILPELLKPKWIGRLAADTTLPLAPVNVGVIDSLAIATPGDIANDPVVDVPDPLMFDKIVACI